MYKARNQDPSVLENLEAVYILCNVVMYLGWLILVIAFSILKEVVHEITKAEIVHTVEVKVLYSEYLPSRQCTLRPYLCLQPS